MGNKGGTLVLLLILCFATVSISQIRAVEADDTIYIRSDGSVDGTELLQRNNNTYTFLNDISGNIVVSKDFITIDGSGYSLKGSGDSSETGIILSFRKNVTVTNLVIMDYFSGIYCKPGAGTTTNITILNNYIRNCDIGIEFLGTSNNLIKYNTFKNNSIDIAINYVSGDNLITHNNLNSYIQVWMSDQPRQPSTNRTSSSNPRVSIMDYSAIILDGYLCCGNLQKETVSKRNAMNKTNKKTSSKDDS